MVFVTDEREMPLDSLRGDKLLEQRRGKLNVLPSRATSHHLPDSPAIVVQVLIRRDAEMKFVPVHGITVRQAKPERETKASMSARTCSDSVLSHFTAGQPARPIQFQWSPTLALSAIPSNL